MTQRLGDRVDYGDRDRRDGASAPSGGRRIARPRLHEFDYLGRNGYHIVSVTKDRRPELVGELGSFAVESIERVAATTAFDALAYTIMPDHVHILIVGLRDDSNAIRFVQRFKQALGYRFARLGQGPLWQESFFDHVLRGDGDVLPIVRYIIDNPAAAGLIDDGEKWPLSGGRLVEIARGTDASLSVSGLDGAEAPSLRPRDNRE